MVWDSGVERVRRFDALRLGWLMSSTMRSQVVHISERPLCCVLCACSVPVLHGTERYGTGRGPARPEWRSIPLTYSAALQVCNS
jgi:hypothetical protein